MKRLRNYMAWVLTNATLLCARAEATATNEGVTAKERERFTKMALDEREETFNGSGVWDWRNQWLLNGIRCRLSSRKNGINLKAEPVPGKDISRSIPWTGRVFLETLLSNTNILGPLKKNSLKPSYEYRLPVAAKMVFRMIREI